MATVELTKEIHKCENLTNWDHDADCNISLESTEVKEGSYSIESHVDDTGGPVVESEIWYDLPSSIDLSSFTHIKFWMKIDSGVLTQYDAGFRLYTDANNYGDWGTSSSGWTLKSLLLSSPSSETGTLDLSNINKILFWKKLNHSHEMWYDYIIAYRNITSDVLVESYIEPEMRESPKAMIIAKGTWIPQKDDIIRINDYYTSAGSTTASQIIFEGVVDDYEQTWIRKIPCFSRAKLDLDEYRPKESLSGDVDSEHLKTLIGKCAYITEGTIDATTPNTSYELKGDKTFRSIYNDWVDKYKKMWSLTPLGSSNFEDVDVDSGEDYDQDDKVWGVRPKKQVRKINKVLIYGALVNNVQLEATAIDQDSINQIGEILYKDTYAMITNQTELNTMATNLLAREAPTTLILSINFWNRHVNKGLLQVGETITFAYSRSNPAIGSQQMILRKIKYFFKKQISYFEVDSGLVFKKNKDKSLPQENSLLIQQNAESIATKGTLSNIVEDTTPQLGGDLDLNAKNIDFPSVANISDCKDEDNMASNSATMLATQQSIKAYVDSLIATYYLANFSYWGSYTGNGGADRVIIGSLGTIRWIFLVDTTAAGWMIVSKVKGITLKNSKLFHNYLYNTPSIELWNSETQFRVSGNANTLNHTFEWIAFYQ